VLFPHPQAESTAFCRSRFPCFNWVYSAFSWRVRFASQATRRPPAVGGGLQGNSQSKHSPNTRRPYAGFGGAGLLDFSISAFRSTSSFSTRRCFR
jgi:hypothetical protein